jgi:hypothetical protein
LKIKEQIRQEESILNMHVCNGKPRNTIKEKQSERDTSTTKAVHDSIPLSVVSSAARQTVNRKQKTSIVNQLKISHQQNHRLK